MTTTTTTTTWLSCLGVKVVGWGEAGHADEPVSRVAVLNDGPRVLHEKVGVGRYIIVEEQGLVGGTLLQPTIAGGRRPQVHLVGVRTSQVQEEAGVSQLSLRPHMMSVGPPLKCNPLA